MTVQTKTRTNEIKAIWKQYQGLYIIVGILIGLMLFPLIELVITNLRDLLTALVPEAIGIGFTVFFLDKIYERRDIESLKRRLIGEAGSRSNETAKSAIDWMRREGWLTGDDGLLKGAHLSFANLRDARLIDANMGGAILEGADLTNAKLGNANLQGANLTMANMTKTRLMDANLIQADLDYAKLGETDFSGANLTDACLLMARYPKNNIIFQSTIVDFEIKATLPDGSSGNIGDDVSRFFDPDHPDAYIPTWIDLDEKRKHW